MSEVASRELRNSTRALLDRVAAGERITITVDGRPVAELGPVQRRPRWMAKKEFFELIADRRADPALRRDLDELVDETTDDLPL
jgi:prevent-host-death family protein